ncbi:flagellar protein FlgN [Sutcliffiella cohnii]
MTLQPVIVIMEKLLALHEGLLQLAVKKTDIVKSGDAKELQQLTKEESKFVKAIGQLEQERLALTANLGTGATISALIEKATDSEADKLLQLKNKLTDVIKQLQERNELNEGLLQQSLQFVQVTLNSINPEPTSVTYEGAATGKKPAAPTRSMFDSKA